MNSNLLFLLDYGAEAVLCLIAVLLLLRIARAVQNIRNLFDIYLQLAPHLKQPGPPGPQA